VPDALLKPSTKQSASTPVPKSTVEVPAEVAVTTSIPAFIIIVPFLTAIQGMTSAAASAPPLSDNAVAKSNSI